MANSFIQIKCLFHVDTSSVIALITFILYFAIIQKYSCIFFFVIVVSFLRLTRTTIQTKSSASHYKWWWCELIALTLFFEKKCDNFFFYAIETDWDFPIIDVLYTKLCLFIYRCARFVFVFVCERVREMGSFIFRFSWLFFCVPLNSRSEHEQFENRH